MKLLNGNNIASQLVAHALNRVAIYNESVINLYTKNGNANNLLLLPTKYEIPDVVRLKISPNGDVVAAQTFTQTIRCKDGVQTPFSTVGHFDVADSGLMVVSDYRNNAVQLITDSITNITATLGADDRVVCGRTKYVIYSPTRMLTALYTDVVFVSDAPAKEIVHIMHVENDNFAIFYKDGTATYKGVTRQTNVPFKGHREQGQHLTLTDYKNDYVVGRKNPLTSPYVLRPFLHKAPPSMVGAEWDKLLLHLPGQTTGTTADLKNGLLLTDSANVTISSDAPQVGGKSFGFNGLTSSLATSDSINLQLGSADFTIEFYVKVTKVAAEYAVIFQKGAVGNVNVPAYALMAYADGTFLFGASATGSAYSVGNEKWGKWEKDVWTHIAITRQGNKWRCFQDGMLQAVYTTTSTLIAYSGNGIQLGHVRLNNFVSGTPAYLLEGLISGFTMRNYAKYTANFFVQPVPLAKTIIRPSDITPWVWTQFSFADNEALEDVSETPVTLTGATITGNKLVNTDQTNPPLTKAKPLYFSATEDFSIEGWFNLASITAYGCTLISIDMLGVGGTGNQQFNLIITQDLSCAFWITPNGTNTNYVVNPDTPKVTLNKDYHLAACRVNGTLTVYLDGVPIYTGSYPNAGFKSTEFLSVRRGATGSRWNMRILRGLSAYIAAFTPPTKLTLTPLYYDAAVEADIVFQSCFRRNALVDEKTANPVTLTSATVANGRVSIAAANASRFSAPCGYFAAADFTIECVGRALAGTGYASAFLSMWTTTGTAGNMFALHRDSTGKVVFSFATSSGTTTLTSTVAIAFNVDIHIVVERYNGVITMYFDGVSVASVANAQAGIDGSASRVLRNNWDDGGLTGNNEITDIRIAKRAMYKGVIVRRAIYPRITALAEIGTNVFRMFNNDGTLNSALTNNGATITNGQATFVAGNYMTLPDDPNLAFGLADFEINYEFSIQQVNTASGSATTSLFYWGTFASGGQPLNFEVGYSHTAGAFFFSTSNDNSALNKVCTYAIVLNTFYKVRIVRRNGNMYFYVNGTLIFTSAFAVDVSYDVSRQLLIGRRLGGTSGGVIWNASMIVRSLNILK